MNDSEFIFATSSEMALELSKRAKELRVNSLKLSQKAFAEKIGLSYGKYQRFEQHGDIKLNDFILVATHLGRLSEIVQLIKPHDIENLGIEQIRKVDIKRSRAGWDK